MIIGGGEQHEVIQAPALGEIYQRMLALRPYELERPMAVEPDLYHQAQAEWDQIMKDRGWYVIAADWVKAPNFLYRGVPIVMANG